MAFDSIPGAQRYTLTSIPAGKLRRRLVPLRAGLSAMLPEGQTLPFVRGQKVSRETLLSEIDAALVAFTAMDQLVVQLRQQRLAVRKLLPAMRGALEAIEAGLRLFYGASNPTLRHFGLKPSQPRRKLDSEEQLVANTRKLETRKIRHTMGKKQKAKLKAT
jgi:hypothetical protein